MHLSTLKINLFCFLFTLCQRVSLRGQPDEDAVLCTTSKTYAVKFVGSSNSVFLIPPTDHLSVLCDNQGNNNMAIASVVKLAPGCMELVEIAPKLDKLRFLLNQNAYSFAEASEMDIPEEREKMKMGLYRWSDLVHRLQASDRELELALQSLSAIEIDGYWRILSEEYMNGILNMLLHNIILNDWSIEALNEDEVVGVLETDGFPRNIAKHVLQTFSSKVDAVIDIRSCIWKLDTQRVGMQLASEILKDGKMKIDIFMEKWLRKVPDGMNASFSMLEGEVLTEKIGMETWVYSFRVSSLPSTPAERFTLLFKERAKWEWKDLQPYVRSDTSPLFFILILYSFLGF